MTANRKVLLCAAIVYVAQFVLAFVVAPYSCKWGNEAYFWAGVVGLVVLFAAPFVLRVSLSMVARVGVAIGLVALGCGVWIAGFAAANLRIICALM